MPRYSFTRDDVVSESEFEAFLGALPTLELKAIAALLWITGARISEVLSLSWAHIHVSENPRGLIISLPTLKKRETGPVAHRREFFIKTGNKYLPVIAEYLRYFAPREGRVFRIHRTVVNDFFTKTGYRITPHILRHTRLTQLARSGAPLDVLMTVHGGELRSITKYAHLRRVEAP